MLEDDANPPDFLIGISGEARLMAGEESYPEERLPDRLPRFSEPKDNRVGGVTLVAGSSLSSGTTGVDVDISMEEEKEFFANKRCGPCKPVDPHIDEIASPIGKNLFPGMNELPL